MPAAYDYYDYPSFWKGREYEHESEGVALKAFLKKIPKVKKLVEVGAGYGRLVPIYAYIAEKAVLTDPSAKLLKIARKNVKGKKFRIIQTSLENFSGKIGSNSTDLVIMVRVLHHIKDLDEAFSEISKIIKPKGHLILEFANKRHFKALLSEFLHGNLTFTLDIFPKDIRSKKSKKDKKTLPFVNYHPDFIRGTLKKHNFTIREERSVSNIRSPFVKKIIPKSVLLFFERVLQRPLAKILFGPSIFTLAQKR